MAIINLGWSVVVLFPLSFFPTPSTVQPNNLAVLFVIMAIIGIGLMTMLPIALELGVELTRNADGSSSILWFS